MSTHRQTLPAALRNAHALLDQVAEGRDIPRRAVQDALQLLGDYDPHVDHHAPPPLSNVERYRLRKLTTSTSHHH